MLALPYLEFVDHCCTCIVCPKYERYISIKETISLFPINTCIGRNDCFDSPLVHDKYNGLKANAVILSTKSVWLSAIAVSLAVYYMVFSNERKYYKQQ